MMPLWAVELAAWFWQQAGEVEPFPRRLRTALGSGSFDVTLKELSRLSVRQVENYLAEQGIFRPTNAPDRPLRACVAAHGGAAWVLLDADDPDDEKTASIAHEFAHFLRQGLQPRLRAIAALGPVVAAALDGHREPTPAEKFSAVLRGLTLGVRVHYLRRDEGRLPPAEEKVEYEADLLAWQLLAPFDEVAHRAGEPDELEPMRALLMTDFGLPATMAADYAAWSRPRSHASPLVQSLRPLLGACRTRRGARE